MNDRSQVLAQLIESAKAHERRMSETVSLIASENQLSPLVKQLLTSDMGNRVAEGWIGERYFPGIECYDQIEAEALHHIRQMFRADFADVRPISGTLANIIVFTALTMPGDTIIAPTIANGAHVSMSGATPQKLFKLNVEPLPYVPRTFDVDVNASNRLIRSVKPKMVVMGGSVILSEQPIAALAAAAHEVGATLLYDASHVVGFIASGHFKNPFNEGADIMTFTSCKTIPGPQHAFVLSREQFASSLKRAAFPTCMSGHHLHETIASIAAIYEFSCFGEHYMRQVICNSRTLARELVAHQIPVLQATENYTDTHMLMIDCGAIGSAVAIEHRLAQANILTNRNMLPWDSGMSTCTGLRVGTQEATRLGMKQEEMIQLAGFIARAFDMSEDLENLRREVSILRKRFPIPTFCFSIDQLK